MFLFHYFGKMLIFIYIFCQANGLLFYEEHLPAKSALFSALKKKKASLFAIFGGQVFFIILINFIIIITIILIFQFNQGNVDDYFSELAYLYDVYGKFLESSKFIPRMLQVFLEQTNSQEARALGFLFFLFSFVLYQISIPSY